MAIALIGLYFLGDWMVDLGYYDTWYHKAPTLHKSIGMVVAAILVFRVAWSYMQPRPAPIEEKQWRVMLAKVAHLGLYVMSAFIIVSGYLITTAKGQGIDIFGLLEFPALFAENVDRGELAGKLHDIGSQVFMLMVLLHTLAALAHHYVFKDATLKRMLRVDKPN